MSVDRLVRLVAEAGDDEVVGQFVGATDRFAEPVGYVVCGEFGEAGCGGGDAIGPLAEGS